MTSCGRLSHRTRWRTTQVAVAGRIVRTARRAILEIDPPRPWADTITTAHARLCALPVPGPSPRPDDQGPEHRQKPR
jgi:hypothetical protein